MEHSQRWFILCSLNKRGFLMAWGTARGWGLLCVIGWRIRSRELNTQTWKARKDRKFEREGGF